MTRLRLKIIHPVVDSDDQRPSKDLLCSRPPFDLDIDFEYLGSGPKVIETDLDAQRALTNILDVARAADADGYDCCIVDCMDDPGLASIREEVEIQAFGMGEVTLHTGLILGEDIAILAPDERSVPSLREMIKDAGIPASRVGIRTLGLSVDTIRSDEAMTIKKVWNEAAAAASSGYGTVVPGCTDISAYLDTLPSCERAATTDIRLLDPVETTVWAVSMVCALNSFSERFQTQR